MLTFIEATRNFRDENLQDEGVMELARALYSRDLGIPNENVTDAMVLAAIRDNEDATGGKAPAGAKAPKPLTANEVQDLNQWIAAAGTKVIEMIDRFGTAGAHDLGDAANAIVGKIRNGSATASEVQTFIDGLNSAKGGAGIKKVLNEATIKVVGKTRKSTLMETLLNWQALLERQEASEVISPGVAPTVKPPSTPSGSGAAEAGAASGGRIQDPRGPNA